MICLWDACSKPCAMEFPLSCRSFLLSPSASPYVHYLSATLRISLKVKSSSWSPFVSTTDWLSTNQQSQLVSKTSAKIMIWIVTLTYCWDETCHSFFVALHHFGLFYFTIIFKWVDNLLSFLGLLVDVYAVFALGELRKGDSFSVLVSPFSNL